MSRCFVDVFVRGLHSLITVTKALLSCLRWWRKRKRKGSRGPAPALEKRPPPSGGDS